MAGPYKHIQHVGNQEIDDLWDAVNVLLPAGTKTRLAEPATILYRPRTRVQLRRDIHLLPLLFDRVILADAWKVLETGDMEIVRPYLNAGVYVPFVAPRMENYLVRGLEGGSSAPDAIYRSWNDVGRAVADSGVCIDMTSELAPDDRSLFVVAIENLATVLTYLDLRTSGFDRKLVLDVVESMDGLIGEKYTGTVRRAAAGQMAYFVLDWANTILLESQLLGLPFHCDDGYKHILLHKGREAAEPPSSMGLARELFDRIGLDLPTKLETRDILDFRASDECVRLRASLDRHIEASGSAQMGQVARDLHIEFLSRVQEFNNAAKSVGETQVALISGVAGTIGGLVAGIPGAILGGAGASAIGVLTKRVYEKFYERNHGDWAVVLNRWVHRS
jgi:hypothetical protein